MQHLNKAHLEHTSGKIDETLKTEACNLQVQPLQCMQYPDLFLQHPHETLATYPKRPNT
jgi:hypothetical protein